MKEDKPTRMWKVISPAIIYLFIRMGIEIIFGVSGIYMEFLGTYRKYGMISDTSFFIERLQRKMGNYSDYTIFLSALLSVIYSGYNIRKENPNILKKMKSSINIQYLVSCIVFAVSLSAAVSSFLSVLPTDGIYGRYDSAGVNILSGNIVFRLLTVGGIVPVAEELIYRGLIYRRIKKEYRVYVAMSVSSLIFAIFTFSFVQGIYTFVMGMAFSLCYELSDDIRNPVLMHMAVNICFVLAGYYGIGNISESAFLVVIMIVVELAAAAVALGTILKMDEKRGR